MPVAGVCMWFCALCIRLSTSVAGAARRVCLCIACVQNVKKWVFKVEQVVFLRTVAIQGGPHSVGQ